MNPIIAKLRKIISEKQSNLAVAADFTKSSELLELAEKIATEAALDRYEFFRDAYLQQREYLVHDGEVPDEYEVTLELDEGFDEEGLAPVNPF